MSVSVEAYWYQIVRLLASNGHGAVRLLSVAANRVAAIPGMSPEDEVVFIFYEFGRLLERRKRAQNIPRDATGRWHSLGEPSAAEAREAQQQPPS